MVPCRGLILVMLSLAGGPSLAAAPAPLSVPDDFPRFLQRTANTFREVQATTYTISTGALGGWQALGTQPAAGGIGANPAARRARIEHLPAGNRHRRRIAAQDVSIAAGHNGG